MDTTTIVTIGLVGSITLNLAFIVYLLVDRVGDIGNGRK